TMVPSVSTPSTSIAISRTPASRSRSCGDRLNSPAIVGSSGPISLSAMLASRRHIAIHRRGEIREELLARGLRARAAGEDRQGIADPGRWVEDAPSAFPHAVQGAVLVAAPRVGRGGQPRGDTAAFLLRAQQREHLVARFTADPLPPSDLRQKERGIRRRRL